MAMASPTPMSSSHFSSLSRRPSTKQMYRQPAARPHVNRHESIPVQTHARTYSLNDSSDEEIPVPIMRFSAITNALLNDPIPSIEPAVLQSPRITPEPENNGVYQFRGGSVGSSQDNISPSGSKIHSPYPRRVVRLSGGPGSSTLRRTRPVAAAVSRQPDIEYTRPESPQDLSTPAPAVRTVRIPRNSMDFGRSTGSAGKASNRASFRQEEEAQESQDYPSTIAKSQFAVSQGSVSRYGASAIGRTRYGEEPGLQSSMRVRRVGKVTGELMKGPARRGRRRVSEDDQDPAEERVDALDSAPSSQEPHNQDQEGPSSRSQRFSPNQEEIRDVEPFVSSKYRTYASGSPASSKEVINSVLRSTSPPPPTLASALRTSSTKSSSALKTGNPVFKIPAPRPELPSERDQENEAPPTFKKNKQAPLIHLNKIEQVPVQHASVNADMLQDATPSKRQPLAIRSQNTPRRPAPPPPKMSILEAATSTAGAATTSNASKKRNALKVNGKYFTRLDCIGRGGSSRVYRVMAENSKFFALKRVSLDDADETTVRGFKGEIDLLKKLEGVERVIRLYDYELNEEKGTLSVVSRQSYWPNFC
jgi:serine/threonine-protein kinase TTK/MPS1